MEIRATSGPWHDGIDFLIRETKPDGLILVVRTLITEPIGPGMYQEPTGRMTAKAAQVLMDDLWAAGLRPTEGSGSAGSLRATEKHLEDMRRIAFLTIEDLIGGNQRVLRPEGEIIK